MDGGFPDNETLSGLEAEKISYVARIKNSAVLDKLAELYITKPVGRPTLEPRMLTIELAYQAASWSKERSVVLIVQE